MATSVFDFSDYRDYLRKEFSGKGEGRGRRIHLARHLRCQTSFLSQVLTDRAHLSLEHAIQASEFLEHSEDERNYFMLLMQRGRAGSSALKAYFAAQISSVHKARENIRDRIQVRTTLSDADQMRYYSTWHYVALHVLAALPGYNTVEQMSQTLHLDMATVKQALGFLEQNGFVEVNNGAYAMTSRRIHLPKNSPMLPRHHSNWRMRAIDSVDREKSNDLHYSAVLGIARKDVRAFKDKLLRLIEESESLLQASKEEVPVVLLIDLFGL